MVKGITKFRIAEWGLRIYKNDNQIIPKSKIRNPKYPNNICLITFIGILIQK